MNQNGSKNGESGGESPRGGGPPGPGDLPITMLAEGIGATRLIAPEGPPSPDGLSPFAYEAGASFTPGGAGRALPLDVGPPIPTADGAPWAGGIDRQMIAMRLQDKLFGGASGALRVGHYSLVRKLGEGGMGIVYIAIDTRLNREVALKLLHPSFTESDQGKPRLLREARVLATVSHPNVVGVYEVDEADGCVYISMELIRGTTLRDWLSGPPRPWPVVVEVLVQAGAGLAAAHRAGLVHRDFKPENVIVGDDGRVKVLDFGLALRRLPQGVIGEPRDGGGPADVHSTLTAPNAVLGTIAYMPPEQFGNPGVDPRSDQFAFVVSLFEALLGQRPFQGRNLPEIIDNIRRRRYAVDPEGGPIPGWLAALLRKGLSASPEERYSSMGELTALLRAGARAEKASAQLARRRAPLPRVASLLRCTLQGPAVRGAGELVLHARSEDGRPLLVAVSTGEPSPEVVASHRLYSDAAARDEGSAFLPVAALIEEDDVAAIALESCHGVPLGDLLRSPPSGDVPVALRIAVALTEALADVRAAGLVLADAMFDGLLIDVTTHRVVVADPTLLAPDTGGDSAGRYRPVATALSALLGRPVEEIPAFTGEDREAAGILDDARLPAQLSRLLAKIRSVRNGYASGRGLRHDLERCLALLEDQGGIAPFTLGALDTTSRFAVPDVLYGRARELGQIREAHRRVARGRAELLLVSGPSGIGKTRLIETACQELDIGRKISGKFNQFGNNEPYATIVQALRQLFRGVLASDDDLRADWRARILAAVPANARLLYGVLPELGLLLGEQPPVPNLPPAESAARFQGALLGLVRACAGPDDPLVVVLDDMQWCDLASISFISSALKDGQVMHVLWVGAFRDDEVGPDHPIVTALRQNASQSELFHHVTLRPLDRESLEELVSQTLVCSGDRMRSMATFLLERTDGNPLFVRTLLTSLRDQGLIELAPSRERWAFRDEAIRSAELPGDIVALIQRKMESLSEPARRVLAVASCIGREVETALLLQVLGSSSSFSPDEILGAVDECVHRGLLSAAVSPRNAGESTPPAPPRDVIESLPPAPLREGEGAGPPSCLAFTHDRVQQAAHNLSGAEQARSIHLEVGRILLERAPSPEEGDMLFRVVGHLNAGRDLASGPLRLRIAHLNLLAGKRATVANAFAEASRFLRTGLSLLPPDHWQSHYELSFEIHLALMHAESLLGDRAAERELFSLLASRARATVDLGLVHELVVSLEASRGEHRSAIGRGVSGLRALGEVLPEKGDRAAALGELVKTTWVLRKHTTLTLLNLEASGRQNSVLLRLLVAMGPPAYLIDSDLLSIIMMRIVRRSLSGGITDVSSYGFAGYGLILSGLFGQHKRARELGMAAAEMNEKFSNKWLQPKIDLMNGIFILPWTDAIEACEEILQRGVTLSVENADFGHASYNATSLACVKYYRGAPLEEVARSSVAMQMYTRQARDPDMTSVLKSLEQVCECLRGRTAGPTDLSIPGWSEKDFAASLSAATTPVSVFFYRAVKIGVLYLHGAYEEACEMGREAAGLEENAFSNPSFAEYLFYHAMSVLRTWESTPLRAKAAALGVVTRAQRLFEKWADLCPANFGPRHLILEAEISRVRGRKDVLHHLNAAVESAIRYDRLHYRALASDLAASHCAATGQPTMGAVYLRAAWDGYLAWGAVLKAKSLGADIGDTAPDAPAISR